MLARLVTPSDGGSPIAAYVIRKSGYRLGETGTTERSDPAAFSSLRFRRLVGFWCYACLDVRRVLRLLREFRETAGCLRLEVLDREFDEEPGNRLRHPRYLHESRNHKLPSRVELRSGESLRRVPREIDRSGHVLFPDEMRRDTESRPDIRSDSREELSDGEEYIHGVLLDA